MQAKIIRRPMIAAGVTVTTDILMLAAAVVLSILRPNFPPEYTCTAEKTIVSSHPYEFFGIPTAIALVTAAVMSGIIVAGAFASGSKKNTAPRVVGAVALLVISAALILFSALVVRGEQPSDTEFYRYTDELTNIVIAEEHYSGYGVTRVFRVTGKNEPAELLASADIHEYATGPERYNLSWAAADVLLIGFTDGMSARTLQISM